MGCAVCLPVLAAAGLFAQQTSTAGQVFDNGRPATGQGNGISTANIPIMVEACTDLTTSVWTPLQILTLTNGLFYFSEPVQTNSSGRYYRIRSP